MNRYLLSIGYKDQDFHKWLSKLFVHQMIVYLSSFYLRKNLALKSVQIDAKISVRTIISRDRWTWTPVSADP